MQWWLSVSALADQFPQIDRTSICTNVNGKLDDHKLCVRWVSKTLTLTNQYNDQQISSGRTFLDRYRLIVAMTRRTNAESKQHTMALFHLIKTENLMQSSYCSRKSMTIVCWDEKSSFWLISSSVYQQVQLTYTAKCS